MKTVIIALFVSFTVFSSSGQSWGLTGNSSTNPGKNFLGTTDEKSLMLRTKNIERLRITANGKVGIGTAKPQQQLDVNGNINVGENSGLYIGNERVLHASGGRSPGVFRNIFIGQFAGNNNPGTENTGVGCGALSAVKGDANAAIGFSALTSNTHGGGNSALGYSTLSNNINGNFNTACGANALRSNTTGSANTALGPSALLYNTKGENNAATGAGALSNNTTGNNNTADGFYALATDSSGSYNTAVGNYADVNVGNITNSTIIGNSALVMASNQVRIGNRDVTSIGGFTDWTNISDGRVKKNIKENVPGLTFINKLKPLTYNLDLDAADKIVQSHAIKDRDGKLIPVQEDIAARKAKEQVVYTGFVAQDVERAAKELNYDFSGVDAAKNEKDLYGLRYSEFVVPLVKAVQELSAKNNELEDKNNELEDKNNELEDKNNQLEKRIERLEALLNAQSSNTSSPLPGNSNISLSGFNVKIAPNPVQSILNIEFNKTGVVQKIISVYDVNGKVLISKLSNGNTALNVKQLIAGTYLIKITDTSGKLLYSGKVVKQQRE